MTRKGFVVSYSDLFKGLMIGIIIGALLAAAVGYFWFYQGDTASTQNQGENTQPSGLEDGSQFSEQEPLRTAASADVGNDAVRMPAPLAA